MQAEAETAERLAERGWPVVPVPFGPHRPSDIEDLIKLASDDPSVARSLFEEAPHSSIGVPLGRRSGTFVVRVEGVEGRTTLAALQGIGRMASSIRSRPDHTIEHIWFELPLGYRVASQNLGEGLDILGEGEIILAPPLSGPKSAQWSYSPDMCELDRPSRWLLKLVGVRIPHDERPNDSSVISMCMALDDAAFAEGSLREDKLLEAASIIASTIGVGQLRPAERFDELLRAAEHNGLSRERRWKNFEPLLLAKLRAKHPSLR